jgi:hypothetical protein
VARDGQDYSAGVAPVLPPGVPALPPYSGGDTTGPATTLSLSADPPSGQLDEPVTLTASITGVSRS